MQGANACLISLLRLACVLFLYSYSSCCRPRRGECHYPYCVLAGLIISVAGYPCSACCVGSKGKCASVYLVAQSPVAAATVAVIGIVFDARWLWRYRVKNHNPERVVIPWAARVATSASRTSGLAACAASSGWFAHRDSGR